MEKNKIEKLIDIKEYEMGQYYKALTSRGGELKLYSLQIKGWREREKTDSWAYNGVKLMEHSYWRNDFMSALTADLYKKPARVAWVGDYADDYEFYGDVSPQAKALHWLAWGGVGDEPTLEAEDIEKAEMTLDNKYLVNHTLKCYLDGNEYFERSKFKWDDTKDSFTCIHPLSILTACGNGLGGGDYEGTQMDNVGAWCWHLLSVEDEIPDGYEKAVIIFEEDR